MSRISVMTGLIATACLLAVTGCDGGQGATATPPTPTGVGSVGGASSAPPAPPPTSAPPTYPSTAEQYAEAAIAAWAARDLSRLDELEVSDGQLHSLYGCNGCYDTHFTPFGCEGAAGSSYCLFVNQVGDSLRLRLSNPALGQARAVGTGSIWDPTAFPSDNKAYAQKALDAWVSGNDARLGLLTANNMTSAQLSALGADKSATWSFASSSGAAGTIGYVWSDGHGHTLAFLFTNGPAAPTSGPASQHRIKQVLYNVA